MKAALSKPAGLSYANDILSVEEETALVSRLETLPFYPVKMHGVESKRAVIHFGWKYEYSKASVEPTAPLPAFIEFLRQRATTFAKLPPGALAQVLIARYPPGAGIGWHHDAAVFGEPVVGVSLHAPCVLRFRRPLDNGGFENPCATAEPTIDLRDGGRGALGVAAWNYQQQTAAVFDYVPGSPACNDGARMKLPREFYARGAAVVARELLGKHLVRVVDGKRRVGKIVETEAYLGMHDLASHSSKGRTARTEVMFGPAGYAYVYLIYGIYWNMNVVCGRKGTPVAVLIRALEPIENLEGRTQGPGLLCKAMGIDKTHYGCDLLGDELYIEAAPAVTPFKIVRSARIGVEYAQEWAVRPLRFFIEGNPYVSRPSNTAAARKNSRF